MVGLEYRFSVVEIAIDTLCLDTFRELCTSTTLKWNNPDIIFNFSTDRKKQAGGSKYGKDEYLHERRRGRRQWHPYVRPDDSGILRMEVALRRPYLVAQGIVSQKGSPPRTAKLLFQEARNLIERNLVFKRLNTTKLRKEIDRSKHFMAELKNKTVHEQYRLLKERLHLPRSFIDRYFDKVPPMSIIFATEWTSEDLDSDELKFLPDKAANALNAARLNRE